MHHPFVRSLHRARGPGGRGGRRHRRHRAAEAAGAVAQVYVNDRALVATLRPLVAAGYTTAGPWEPDPALAVPPLPLLDPARRLADLPPDSDEARFLRVDLTRARNRVVAALETALAAARTGLAELDSSHPAPGGFGTRLPQCGVVRGDG